MLSTLVSKIDNKEINYQSMKYGNIQVHSSSVVKSERIKFFIEQVSKVSDLLYQFQSLNLTQILQNFSEAGQRMSNETRS